MRTIWWNIEGSMADSRPCLLGNSLGSGGTSAPKITAVSTETIQQQILQTENDLKTWCNKKSCETGTTKKMKSYVMADCRLVCLSMGKTYRFREFCTFPFFRVTF